MNSQNISYGTLPYNAYTSTNSQNYNNSILNDKENIPIHMQLFSKDEMSKIVSNKLDEGFKQMPFDLANKTMQKMKPILVKDTDELKVLSIKLKSLTKDFTKQIGKFLKNQEQVENKLDDILTGLNNCISHFIDTERLLKKAMKTIQLTDKEAEELKKITEVYDYKKNLAFMEFHKNVFMQESILKDLKKILEERFNTLAEELVVIGSATEKLEEDKKYIEVMEMVNLIKADIGKKDMRPVKVESKGFDINAVLNKIIKPTQRTSFAFYN
jgi:hypothetical protein